MAGPAEDQNGLLDRLMFELEFPLELLEVNLYFVA